VGEKRRLTACHIKSMACKCKFSKCLYHFLNCTDLFAGGTSFARFHRDVTKYIIIGGKISLGSSLFLKIKQN